MCAPCTTSLSNVASSFFILQLYMCLCVFAVWTYRTGMAGKGKEASPLAHVFTAIGEELVGRVGLYGVRSGAVGLWCSRPISACQV